MTEDDVDTYIALVGGRYAFYVKAQRSRERVLHSKHDTLALAEAANARYLEDNGFEVESEHYFSVEAPS